MIPTGRYETVVIFNVPGKESFLIEEKQDIISEINFFFE
jgi:hypothetical protein